MKTLVVLITRISMSIALFMISFLLITLCLPKKWANCFKVFVLILGVSIFYVNYSDGNLVVKNYILLVYGFLLLFDRLLYEFISWYLCLMMLFPMSIAILATNSQNSSVLIQEIKEDVSEYEYYEFHMEYTIYKMFNLNKSEIFAKIFDGLLSQRENLNRACSLSENK